MRDSESRASSSSSYRRVTPSRERDRDRDSRRDRDRDHERDRDRDYYSSRKRSKSRKSKRKHKKKGRHGKSSSSDSSSSSDESRKSSSRCKSNRTSRARTPVVQEALAVVNEIDDYDSWRAETSIAAIEADTFEPSTFYSTRDREAPAKKTATEKVIIDLNAETVTVAKAQETSGAKEEDEQIFHPNFLGDAELKTEKWIHKLFVYRQKFFQE